jgi:hypothetical protein
VLLGEWEGQRCDRLAGRWASGRNSSYLLNGVGLDAVGTAVGDEVAVSAGLVRAPLVEPLLLMTLLALLMNF